jgi:hypothetical protein
MNCSRAEPFWGSTQAEAQPGFRHLHWYMQGARIAADLQNGEDHVLL